MRRLLSRAWLAAMLAIVPVIAIAANYDEAVQGDLSGTPASPTAWSIGPGANVLKGSAGTSADYDLVTFTIPVGHQLETLTLDQHVIQGYQSFLGLQAGSAWTAGLDWGVDGTALLGYDLFGTGDVGTDRLSWISDNGNTIGPQFTPPLPSGTYTMLLQDVQTEFSYQFTLNVSAVPEPATMGLAAFGLLVVCRLARPR